MTELLTINLDRVQEIITKAVEFTNDQTLEKDILELMEAEKTLDAALSQVKAAFKKALPELEMDSLEGDSVKVTISPSGSRFAIVDESAVDPAFFKISLDPTAVNNYVENNQVLPAGVGYNEARGISVRMSIKKGANGTV